MALKKIKISALFIPLLAALPFQAMAAQASPLQAFPAISAQEQPLVLSANVDCAQSAQQVISQTGGELLSATPSIQNGQSVCKITVLVKSSSGQRPKKLSVTVPQ